MISHILCLCTVLVLLSSCSGLGREARLPSVQLKPVNTNYVEQKAKIEANYSFNKLLTAYVGEPVIKRRKLQQTVQSELTAVPVMDALIAGGGFQVGIREGQMLPIEYETLINGVRYTAAEIQQGQNAITLLFDETGLILDRILVNGITAREAVRVSPINARVSFARPERVINQQVVENYEIVFSGVNSDQLQFVYREYSPDNVARTAFFQELTYPRDTEFIRYKSLKIRVQQITSEGLIYEVLTD